MVAFKLDDRTRRERATGHRPQLRRRRAMTTAGELLWDLVPPQVLATDAFVLAALLEPW
jgi:hypothetical protein